MSCMSINDLPRDCIAQILWLTSPPDAIRSSAVSKRFLMFAQSDDVWEKFLPSDLIDVVSQSSTPNLLQQLPSKQALFLHLCRNPLLLKTLTQSFALDKRSGKICYMLGARALSITWGNTPAYWRWRHLPCSRSLDHSMEPSPLQWFPESAELIRVWWLLIEGTIKLTILSPNTTYGAYFVYEMSSNNSGFKHTPVKVSLLEVLQEEEEAEEEELLENLDHEVAPFKSFYLSKPRVSVASSRGAREDDRPCARDDGKIEIEMGRYYVSDCVNERMMLKMTLKEIEKLHCKSGIIVHGIELRPLD